MAYVVKSNVKKIYGLTEEQKREIKQALTYSNPKYEAAIQFSLTGRAPANIPQYLTYYEERGKYLEVPLHFPLPFPSKVIRDQRVTNHVEWPELQVILREGQQRAFDAFMSNPENGQVILDTGEGKSILGYALASALNQKLLVLIDRDIYMQPWLQDLELAFGGAINVRDVGLIKSRTWKIGEHVTLGFFQTLNNRDLTELSKEFGIIIHDESDTAAAPTRFSVVQQFKAKYRLAISGTVERSDGLHFLHRYLYGDFAVNLQGQGKNILTGDQVEIRRVETGFSCKVPIRLSKFRVYQPNGKSEDMDTVVDHVKLSTMEAQDKKSNFIKLYYIENEIKQGETCLVLTHRVSHATALWWILRRRGYNCATLHGSTPRELKESIPKDANSGEIQCIISTFQYIKRGADIPKITRVFAVTQTANETELRQAIGRGRRTHTEVTAYRKNGKVKIRRKEKNHIIWYDFTTNLVWPYRSQADRRLELWKRMKFKIRNVKVPKEVLEEYENSKGERHLFY